jgi:dGTPase
VAYVNHDIDDAIRAGLIRTEDLPPDCLRVLGTGHAQRITTMINAIIAASTEVSDGQRLVRERIAMEDEVMEATDCLKNWMFEHVYKLEPVDETRRVRNVIHALFEIYMEQPELMSRAEGGSLHTSTQSAQSLPQDALARHVCDFIAGMTDRFASQIYADLFMPSSWRGV